MQDDSAGEERVVLESKDVPAASHPENEWKTHPESLALALSQLVVVVVVEN